MIGVGTPVGALSKLGPQIEGFLIKAASLETGLKFVLTFPTASWIVVANASVLFYLNRAVCLPCYEEVANNHSVKSCDTAVAMLH